MRSAANLSDNDFCTDFTLNITKTSISLSETFATKQPFKTVQLLILQKKKDLCLVRKPIE